MTNFNKKYKKLYKNYNKQLKKLHKKSFEAGTVPIPYFVTYLQFLRDVNLLNSPLTDKLGDDNINLASIVAALSEFQKYENTIYNYYHINGNKITRKPDISETEAQLKFQEEKQRHWDAFWNIIRVCIEGWNLNAML